MGEFQVLRPRGLEEALQWLAEGGSRTAVLAGGTDLFPQQRAGHHAPYLLDLWGVEELRFLEVRADGLRLGPLLTMREVADSPLVRDGARALAQAALSVGSPQIRNRATLGGNLGRASPAADACTALVALRARLELSSFQGRREMAAAEFLVGPGKTLLRPDELITAITLPGTVPGEGPGGESRGAGGRPLVGSSFQKVGRRKAVTLTVASAAARLALDRSTGKVLQADAAAGAVAPRTLAMEEVAEVLVGVEPTPAALRRAARAGAARARPVDDVRSSAAYRRAVLPVLIQRALEESLRDALQIERSAAL